MQAAVPPPGTWHRAHCLAGNTGKHISTRSHPAELCVPTKHCFSAACRQAGDCRALLIVFACMRVPVVSLAGKRHCPS